jgi:hypothetical protein
MDVAGRCLSGRRVGRDRPGVAAVRVGCPCRGLWRSGMMAVVLARVAPQRVGRGELGGRTGSPIRAAGLVLAATLGACYPTGETRSFADGKGRRLVVQFTDETSPNERRQALERAVSDPIERVVRDTCSDPEFAV